MLKAFFRDSIVYGLAKVLTGAITLISLPIYTRALAPGAYGVVDLLTAVAAVVHVTVALEIATGLARYVNSPETDGAHTEYASTALWFTLGAYGLFAFLVMPFAGRISERLFSTSNYASAVRIAVIAAWSTGTFYLLQNVLRYERRALRFATISLSFSILSVGCSVVLLFVFHAGVTGLFVGQLVAGLGAIALGGWFLRDILRPIFDLPRCRQMLTFSAPLVPSGVGVMLSLYVDRYAVAHLLSLSDLGLYAVGARLASIVPIAVAGFQFAITPLVFQHYKDAGTPRQLARIFQWFLTAALPLVLFMGLFSRELVGIIVPSAYASAGRIVFPLSGSFLVASFYNFSPGLWIAKRTPWIAVISLSSGAINLALDFLLIPKFGLLGAAMANLGGSTFAATAHFVCGQWFYRIPFRWTRVAAAFGLTAAGGTLGASGVFHALGAPTFEAGLKAILWLTLSILLALVLLGTRELTALRESVAAMLRNARAQVQVSVEGHERT